MDGKRPKRRKDKHNPYSISQKDGRYYLSWRDAQDMEIDKQLYDTFNAFELEDLSYLNTLDRHIAQSELSESALYDMAFYKDTSVEDTVIQSIQVELLHKYIAELPEIQRRRLCLYYFDGLTYEQIAEMEDCTKRAVKFSVDLGIKKLREKISHFSDYTFGV